MKLKNIFSSIGIVAVSVLALSSCGDFLDEGPKTALTEKDIYSDTTKVESTLKKLYSNWEGTFKDRHLWECMVGTDEIQSGTTLCSQPSFRISQNLGQIVGLL